MYCIVDGIKLFYKEEGEGAPLLILHGFPVDHRSLYYTIETAMQKTTKSYRRVYLDLPGMGKSDAPTKFINADKVLEIVTQFAKFMFQNQPFSVIGFSYGGYLALGMAKKEPEMLSNIILMAPMIFSDPDKRNLPIRHMHTIEEFEVKNENVFETYKNRAANITEEGYQRYLKEIYMGLIAGKRLFLKLYENRGHGFTFEDELFDEPIFINTLMLLGWEDDVSGYADLLVHEDVFLMHELVMIEHAGHNMQIDAFDEVIYQISKFLSEADT